MATGLNAGVVGQKENSLFPFEGNVHASVVPRCHVRAIRLVLSGKWGRLQTEPSPERVNRQKQFQLPHPGVQLSDDSGVIKSLAWSLWGPIILGLSSLTTSLYRMTRALKPRNLSLIPSCRDAVFSSCLISTATAVTQACVW